VGAALDLVESRRLASWYPAVRHLLEHKDATVRRRALAILRWGGDSIVAVRAAELLRDPDLGVRTEALLAMCCDGKVDPLQQIEELGDFEDFSIRAAMAAFFTAPGPAQNIDAARAIIDGMVRSGGADGVDGARDRSEAARLLAVLPPGFAGVARTLLADSDPEVVRHALRSVPPHDELLPDIINGLAVAELAGDAAAALARFGERILPEIEARLRDDTVPIEIRRELPSVLVRIGTPAAEQALMSSLLQGDAALRFRVVSSLNKLRETNPHLWIDPRTIEVLLAAEIAGHYRSYQALGPLRTQLRQDSTALAAMERAMEHELERIFRLMALAHPIRGLHDAYVGVRSANRTIRANALEFLENVLAPDIRNVLLPLIDSQVTVDERIALANRFVGAPLETAEQAVATLLASEDAFLRSTAIYAVGALQLHELEPEVRKYEGAPDPMVRDSVQATLARLSPDAEEANPAFGSY
jgi:HEAT repeat protein